MQALSALDLVSWMGPKTGSQLLAQPNGLAHGAFSLICASEAFEQVVPKKFRMLADELCNSASFLFESVNESPRYESFATALNPKAKYQAFDRFERLFLCLNALSDEFMDDDWRAQLAWRNVQDFAKAMKSAMIRSAA